MCSVSPLDDMDTAIGRSEIPLAIPPSSRPLDLSCSHSEIQSDSSWVLVIGFSWKMKWNSFPLCRQSECSEGDGGDVTPCNLSPCIGAMDSVTPPAFRSLNVGMNASHQSHSLEDIDATWRTQFQSFVTEGGPAQMAIALHLLPRLYRVELLL